MDWAELTAVSAAGRILAGQEKTALVRGALDVVDLMGKYPKAALGLGTGAVVTGGAITKGAKTFQEQLQQAKMQAARPSMHLGGLY